MADPRKQIEELAGSRTDPFEGLARVRKSIAIADIADALGWTATMAAHASERDWRTVSSVAGVPEPSDFTKDVVVKLLTQREERRTTVANLRRMLEKRT